MRHYSRTAILHLFFENTPRDRTRRPTRPRQSPNYRIHSAVTLSPQTLMRPSLIPSLHLLFISLSEFQLFSSSSSVSAAGNTLGYDQPSSHWTEALSVGNGRLAAMVFGGIREELLQLNDATFWTGESSN